MTDRSRFKRLLSRDRRDPSWLRWLAYSLLGAILGGALLGVAVASLIRIPDVEELADFSPGLITEILDRDEVVFQSYAREHRTLLEEGEMPDLLRETLLAAEDKNFYQHGGLDLWAIVRSSVMDIRLGYKATGASTITMQLANIYFDLSREKRWRRKIAQAVLAVELEKSLSKEQILTLYANIVNLGKGRYGFKEAARYYFNKDLDELTAAQAATLAAINRRPVDTPYNRPRVIQQRRDLVLNRMRSYGFLSQEALEIALATPIEVVKRRREAAPGRYFSEDVRRHLLDEYGADSLYDRGLRVHTTLDRTMQLAAEKAVRKGISQLDERWGWRKVSYHLQEEDLSAVELPSWPLGAPVPGAWHEGLVLEVDDTKAVVKIGSYTYDLEPAGMEWTGQSSPAAILEVGDVTWFELVTGEAGEPDRLLLHQEPEVEAALVFIESRTGAVRAMVGGWDFERSEFNRVTQARRQVGSAFKPFIFGAALEMGYTPADTLFDGPVAFRGADNRDNYSPRNFKRRYYGIVTLRRALEQSINVTTAKLLDLVGVDRVIDFAQRAGIESYLPPYPSLALGTAELTPLEVAAAYGTLANQGVRIEPYLIQSVSARDGRILEEHVLRPSEVIEPKIAFLLIRILEGVFARGTATSARNLGLSVAGKTGTTDSFTDAWFAGFTPRYTLLVWVGYDQGRVLGPGMTGAAVALPIWRTMIEEGIQAGWLDPDETFSPPPGLSTKRVEYRTGLLQAPGATSVITETFITGTEPAQVYESSWDRVLELPWYLQRVFYGVPKAGERMPEDVSDWTPVQESWEIKDQEQDSDEEDFEALEDAQETVAAGGQDR